MSPAACYVVAVVSAVTRGDLHLARWCARQAVLARVSALWDDGEPVDVEAIPELVSVQPTGPEGRLVGAERCDP